MGHKEGEFPSIPEMVAANRQRLEEVVVGARASGAKWVVECRDMWDAQDSDGGIYFAVCKTDREVDRVAARCTGSHPDNRLLGVFDVAHAPEDQWPGLKLDEWQARRAAEGWPLTRRLKELLKR